MNDRKQLFFEPLYVVMTGDTVAGCLWICVWSSIRTKEAQPMPSKLVLWLGVPTMILASVIY